MELDCAVQKYAWGVIGSNSSVAQLAAKGKPSFVVEEKTPYAELWMGTHPNGPSLINGSSMTLLDYINNQTDILGKPVLEKFGPNLPFLFKVLSVNKALSIQAHPNKKHAEELHETRPDVYKDPNHKPEMALALTPFQALCGFRPAAQIINFFQELPELSSVIGQENTKEFISAPSSNTLKTCFSALMNADKDAVKAALIELKEKLEKLDSDKGENLLKSLFLTLHDQYPGDGGCFSIYLLNYLTLQPGEAMFLGPNVIHAYLKGSCMECMACSDNVVRAGLTPKYQDVATLVSMLEYEMCSAESRKFEGEKKDESTVLFNPPVPDFAVEMIKIKSSSSYSTREVPSASILAVVEGDATVSVSPSSPQDNITSKISRGSVLFLKAGQVLTIEAGSALTAYRALCVL